MSKQHYAYPNHEWMEKCQQELWLKHSLVVGSNTHQLFEFIGQAKQQPKRFHQEDDGMSVAVVITLLRLVLHLRQYYDALLLIILEAENKYH